MPPPARGRLPEARRGASKRRRAALSSVTSPCAGCGGAPVAAGRVLHVRATGDLARLARTWNRYDAVHLASDQLDERERALWERRLFSAYSECGCDAGAAAVVIALVAYAVAAVTERGARTWTTVGLAVAATFGAALAGKIVGIVVARLRLRRDIRRLSARLGA